MATCKMVRFVFIQAFCIMGVLSSPEISSCTLENIDIDAPCNCPEKGPITKVCDIESHNTNLGPQHATHRTCNTYNQVFEDPGSIIKPCSRSDEACMVESANKVVPVIAAGIPSLNVDPIDPIRLMEFQVKDSKFFVNATNNEISGYKNCEFQSVKFNWEDWTLKLGVTCHSITISGHLEVSGELLGVPVEGNNEYKITSGQYLLTLSSKFDKVKGSDGKMHMIIKDVVNSSELRGDLKFDYDGFKPKTELTPEAAENFKENCEQKFIQLTRPSLAKRKYEYIFNNVNKLLESVPFDDLFTD